MDPRATVMDPRATVIDPYYVRGDVFQRDSRYYDQLIGTRRNRTPNKSGYLPEASYVSNIRTNEGAIINGPGAGSTVNDQLITNQVVVLPPPQPAPIDYA
jgi:hypothetical protein